jgi:predicted ABC-type sugar transport system permease subunit
MKLSLKSMIIAGALFKALCFLFISLLNLILRPYGGAYLAILISLYPGYDPVSVPIGMIVGTLYSLLAGGLAGLLFGWLYNFFAERS